MLIIPLSHKITFKNFPFMTALLVVINVFVYFALQVPDERVEKDFTDAYAKSGLPQQEFPAYLTYLSSRGKHPKALPRSVLEDPDYVAGGALLIQHDRVFKQQLEHDMKQALDAEQFAQWQAARIKVDAIWQRNFTERYIFIPAVARAETVFTHMFMHADIGHLLGNMIMLVLIGLLVESAVGAIRTAAIYLAGGAGALLLYSLLSPDHWIGMLGASGAIAALMGACAALYGMRKVRFFYHVLFYFDFVTLPAIVVLPLWIVNELWQWAQYREVSNVAYFAHIGGLIAGAALAVFFRKTVARRLQHAGTPSLEKMEDIARLHERAYGSLKKMQWAAAGREFEQLLKKNPGNLDYAKQLYFVSRSEPASERYHRSAKYLMKLSAKSGAPDLLGETITEYWKSAQPAPKLNAAEIAGYIKILAKHGPLSIAISLAEVLLKLPGTKISPAELADVVLALAVALHRANNIAEKQQSRRYIAILETRFPGSEQLRLAHQLVTA